MKLSENLRLFNDFSGNRSSVIYLNSLNYWNELCRRSGLIREADFVDSSLSHSRDVITNKIVFKWNAGILEIFSTWVPFSCSFFRTMSLLQGRFSLFFSNLEEEYICTMEIFVTAQFSFNIFHINYK